MQTTITSKGQVTIPKHIRDAMHLTPGNTVEFDINAQGQVILQKVAKSRPRKPQKDRFELARGKAEIKWKTDDLMSLLRDSK